MLWLGKQNKSKALEVTPNDDLRRDLTAGADLLERAENSSLWNWYDGSRLFMGVGLGVIKELYKMGKICLYIVRIYKMTGKDRRGLRIPLVENS